MAMARDKAELLGTEQLLKTPKLVPLKAGVKPKIDLEKIA